MTAAWRVGTVVDARPETATARRLVIEVPDWPGNDAGQHLDVRLTAPDGYQATRSYSIASAGPGSRIELAVDRVPDGEVSPYLVDDVLPGDQLEVHGPLGGYFVWRPGDPRPVQLVGGGSGVVPLVAMARAHATAGDGAPFRLLYSVRTPDDVFYRDELAAAAAASPLRVDYVYTRRALSVDEAAPGRLTRERLEAVAVPAEERPRVFVCGPTGFVEQVAAWLQELGHAAGDIRTERFGGS
ncbi:ferredoxin reductase [Pseudolysinimonas sp.]|uniref:ferredoxin reductase n=1 Tax=Pseudolysinimonas sp. TaxID=2680009 RepID=UPI003F7D714A